VRAKRRASLQRTGALQNATACWPQPLVDEPQA
jgi:hypothetical protein